MDCQHLRNHITLFPYLFFISVWKYICFIAFPWRSPKCLHKSEICQGTLAAFFVRRTRSFPSKPTPSVSQLHIQWTRICFLYGNILCNLHASSRQLRRKEERVGGGQGVISLESWDRSWSVSKRGIGCWSSYYTIYSGSASSQAFNCWKLRRR